MRPQAWNGRCHYKDCVNRAYLPPTDEELAFDFTDGEVTFTVPKLECHTSVVLKY